MPARTPRLISTALLLLVACADTDAGPSAEDARAGRALEPPAANTDSTGVNAGGPEEPSPAAWTAGLVQEEHEVTGTAVLGDVRVAENEGFDRIVLEFIGEELPSYRIEYVDDPVRECGSGEAVEVPGDGWLLIRLDPSDAHDDQGQSTIDERRMRSDLPVLLEARVICDFEANVEFVLGVAAPNLFRVMELSEPARLIVDIRH